MDVNFMDIYLHNTLTDKKEIFKPIKKGMVSIYNCGPTVYDLAHIGNFRTFIMADVLRRMFEYNGLGVNQVMNITDVDDKTIKKSQEKNVSLEEITRKYEEKFFEDLNELNILTPTKTPRATDNISEMVDMIQDLLDKGIAYKSEDGIYFDISKSPEYGKLAKLNLESVSGERINNDEYDKENPRDFALWKFHNKNDGDIFYEVPFGKGRPGWHIECSVMSTKNLGDTIDIHTGGIDLVFPHHTNEIAQSEAVTGKKFVNYWIHGGFITVDGKKMSKSLGNIFTLKDIKDKKIDPLAFRYFVLGAHYDSLLNFTWEALEGAENALKKLRAKINEKDGPKKTEDKNILESNKNIFNEYINDDLDFPKALALVWQIVRDDHISALDKKNQILDFDRVLGLRLDKIETINIPDNIKKLVEERNIARAKKNFGKSDKIRKEIESFGFEVKDTQDGTEISIF